MSSENILFAAGRSFVHTYYKLMFQDPLVLHKLYKSESNLSITLNNDEKPNLAQGTAEIKNQIEALQLKLPLVLVKVADVLPTSNDCILISVVGTLQNEGEKPKQFHDTFVLAPQKPQGYFIRSHISRYLDVHEEPATESVSEETEVQTLESVTPEPEEVSEPQSEPVEAQAPEPIPAPEPEVREVVQEIVTSKPEPVAPVQAETPPPAKTKSNSWRDVVKPPAPKKPSPLSAAPTPVGTGPAPSTPQEPASDSSSKFEGKGKSPKPKTFTKGSRDPQRVIVVRNILGTTTEETLQNFFSVYGKVMSVTLLGKALAFIEFERPASATKVLQVETPIVIDNKEVKVELKKRKPPADKKGSPSGKPRNSRPPGSNQQGTQKREKPTLNKPAEL